MYREEYTVVQNVFPIVYFTRRIPLYEFLPMGARCHSLVAVSHIMLSTCPISQAGNSLSSVEAYCNYHIKPCTTSVLRNDDLTRSDIAIIVTIDHMKPMLSNFSTFSTVMNDGQLSLRSRYWLRCVLTQLASCGLYFHL